MERYLGLDVHAASSTLAVISESGRRARYSAGYGGFPLGIVRPPLPRDEVSPKPGQLHSQVPGRIREK